MDPSIEIVHARREDLPELLELYRQLHEADPVPEGMRLDIVWDGILKNPDYHILLFRAGGRLAASVSVIVIQNLTRSARPYAVIENVITDAAYRKQGYAARLMAEAVRIAQAANCYKVSLTTGRKDESIFHFYESCGFNREDKTAFIKWL